MNDRKNRRGTLAPAVVFVACALVPTPAADNARQIVEEAQRRTEASSQRYEGLLQVFDASDPLAPVEVGRLEPAVDLPEQVADFAVSGDTVYAAGSRDGVTYTIYALDISDPTHPAGIWRIEMPAPENVTKMVLTGDTVYLRLNSGSLLALNISDETLPYLAGNFPLRISDFAVDGDLLYLAAGDAGLVVLQVDH